MDSQNNYDVIVCGTSLYNCLISSLLSQSGKNVLHLDRNCYFGGEFPGFNLENIYHFFRPGEQPSKEFGQSRYWSIDLAPRILLEKSKLATLFTSIGIDRYFEFQTLEQAFICCSIQEQQEEVNQNKDLTDSQVQQIQDLKNQVKPAENKSILHSIPTNSEELNSALFLSPQEKQKYLSFLFSVEKSDEINLNFSQLLDKFGLEITTKRFIETAICQCQQDQQIPSSEGVNRLKQFSNGSKNNFFDINNHHLFPMYGVTSYMEGASRLVAVNGGTFMLSLGVDKISQNCSMINLKTNSSIKDFENLTCQYLISDHTYQSENKVKVGQVIRCICILDHGISSIINCYSASIVIPYYETNRKHNINILMIGKRFMVCPNQFQVVHITTMVETDNPENELQSAFDLLGDIKEKFFHVSDIYESVDKDNVFMIRENFVEMIYGDDELNQVFRIYKQIMGVDFVFKD